MAPWLSANIPRMNLTGHSGNFSGTLTGTACTRIPKKEKTTAAIPVKRMTVSYTHLRAHETAAN
ncbi:hypothetical protein, partial [uncultured Akkermansia sp.]|uniref:hypothetical protein n=1 Tax=uncultured Akkermansia sp. TaxID=512294 RepID=UPI002594AE97